MWLTNGCWTSPITYLWSGLKPEGNHSHDHKEVLERTIFAIIVDFKDTPDQIVISWGHWRMQVLRGQENQEMTKGIGLLSNQEVEMVIPKWWMWWKWSMHSSPVWQDSLKGLKAITLVPNPIGISPKHTWCVGEEGCSCMITYYVHALILPMFRDICSCILTCIILFVSTTFGY